MAASVVYVVEEKLIHRWYCFLRLFVFGHPLLSHNHLSDTQCLVLALLGSLWLTICCNTVRGVCVFALTFMMRSALGVVHLEFLEDFFTPIPLKVPISFVESKLLWQGVECWKECLNLLSIAEAAVASRESTWETREFDQKFDGFIVRRRGILRPAMNMKNFNVLNDNAQNCLGSCRIESIDKDAAQNLVPNLCVPFNSAFYMPEAVNIHPQRYLQALFLACENLVKEMPTLGFGGKELYLHKKSVNKLLDLAGEYDAVIICLGAKADMLPELSGRLPLRTCRGVIAHLQLPDDTGEAYPDHSPSILSDAWLAVQGTRNLYMGATWEWNSRNYSPNVSAEETSKALQELLPKMSTVYPCIKDWTLSGAKAGLRAMPPLTPNGSLPLLGCVDDFVGGNHTCKYWLFGGLGSRGLLYHGWLGKLMAQAVLSCNEKLIPSELISWKKIKQ